MKRNKTSWWLQRAVLALCLGSLLLCLCACTGGNGAEDDSTAIEETESEPQAGGEAVYTKAPSCYEATDLGWDCGTLKTGSASVVLYEIKGSDPVQWVATKDGAILYNKDMPLPTLEEMKPVAVSVSASNYTSINLGCLEDADAVQALVEQVSSGASVQKPLRSASAQYVIRFESETYPSICYKLEYLEYLLPVVEDGVDYGYYFLYDQSSGRMVAVDETLYDFLNGTDGEVGTGSIKTMGRYGE